MSKPPVGLRITPEHTARALKAKGPSTFTQIVEMQALLLKDCKDEKTPAGYRAQCVRAWDVLEERRRILRMRPKPRDIDVSDHVAKRKASRLPPPLILEQPPTEADIQRDKESTSQGQG